MAGPLPGGTAFRDARTVIDAATPDEVPAAFAATEAALAQGRWLAGYATYELGYVLCPRLRPCCPRVLSRKLIAVREGAAFADQAVLAAVFQTSKASVGGSGWSGLSGDGMGRRSNCRLLNEPQRSAATRRVFGGLAWCVPAFETVGGCFRRNC